MDQRMDALRRANEVRALRAQLKRDLQAGRVSIGALLLDPPPLLETAKVFEGSSQDTRETRNSVFEDLMQPALRGTCWSTGSRPTASARSSAVDLLPVEE